MHAGALSRVTHGSSVCITKRMCLDAGCLANFIDRTPRTTIKIVESLQREGSAFRCFRVNSLLELLARVATARIERLQRGA